MKWRDAYLRQGISEAAVWRLLSKTQLEYSHRLHYLQMITEKLSKGFMTGPRALTPASTAHHAFVRLLRVIQGRPEFRQQLGFEDFAAYRWFLRRVLPLAEQVESLAPSAAGLNHPNPEYPWRSGALVVAPVEYAFPLLGPGNPDMIRLERFVEGLIAIAAREISDD